jgi:hypothetical protein
MVVAMKYGRVSARINGLAVMRPPALPWDSLHQLFGTMGNMNSGHLISAAAGLRRRNSAGVGNRGGHHPGYALASPASVRDTPGGGQFGPTPPPRPPPFAERSPSTGRV